MSEFGEDIRKIEQYFLNKNTPLDPFSNINLSWLKVKDKSEIKIYFK